MKFGLNGAPFAIFSLTTFARLLMKTTIVPLLLRSESPNHAVAYPECRFGGIDLTKFSHVIATCCPVRLRYTMHDNSEGINPWVRAIH